MIFMILIAFGLIYERLSGPSSTATPYERRMAEFDRKLGRAGRENILWSKAESLVEVDTRSALTFETEINGKKNSFPGVHGRRLKKPYLTIEEAEALFGTADYRMEAREYGESGSTLGWDKFPVPENSSDVDKVLFKFPLAVVKAEFDRDGRMIELTLSRFDSGNSFESFGRAGNQNYSQSR
jgi:hypothetical protein